MPAPTRITPPSTTIPAELRTSQVENRPTDLTHTRTGATSCQPGRRSAERDARTPWCDSFTTPIGHTRPEVADAAFRSHWDPSASTSVAATSRTALRPLIHDFYYGLRTLVADVLAEGRAGLLAEEINIPIETERLASLITGLDIGAVLHPEPMSPDTMLSVLRRHLDSRSVPPADGHTSRKAGEEPAR